MGSRSGARSWGIGDGKFAPDPPMGSRHFRTNLGFFFSDSDPEIDTSVRPTARSRQSKPGADLEF
jgi:hypothetical protein